MSPTLSRTSLPLAIQRQHGSGTQDELLPPAQALRRGQNSRKRASQQEASFAKV